MRDTAVVHRRSSFSTKAIIAFAFWLIGIGPVPLLVTQTLSPVQLEKIVVPGTHSLDASVVDLAGHGYEEDKYYARGVANRFRISNPLDTAKLLDSGHPYKTRIVVRRPLDPRRFKGTVIVE